MAWSYEGSNGPEFWHKSFAAANGHRQSPIDIEASKWKVSQTLSAKKFKTHYSPYELTCLVNTNNHWKISGDHLESHISGGPLRNTYQLSQVHAHWGEGEEGSEHTVDGKHYPCELHFVHWNSEKYATSADALDHEDGLCVVGVFVKLGKSHPEIQKIVEHIPDILHKDDSVNVSEPVSPQRLLPNRLRYWSYSGSLTTPPCKECVIWIVLHDPIEISEEQLEAFKTLRCHTKQENSECEELTCGDRIGTNHRPVCPLGHRLVIRTRYEHEEKN